jgi:hypothetical protein
MHFSCTENFTTATVRNPGDETHASLFLQLLLVLKMGGVCVWGDTISTKVGLNFLSVMLM